MYILLIHTYFSILLYRLYYNECSVIIRWYDYVPIMNNIMVLNQWVRRNSNSLHGWNNLSSIRQNNSEQDQWPSIDGLLLLTSQQSDLLHFDHQQSSIQIKFWKNKFVFFHSTLSLTMSRIVNGNNHTPEARPSRCTHNSVWGVQTVAWRPCGSGAPLSYGW